ncbi:MAG: ABC transporter ATP-binding protein [Methanoregula sp.]|nr:MAG: ABC transporter ATP-binding protein [Methanoregula sp.]
MIRISGLSRRFGDREVIKDIDLEIRHGEIFALIGPSGSGKTTMLRLIDLLDRPSDGSIIFDGLQTEGKESERRSIRRRMAMVFQKPGVLNTTVERNVAFGLEFRGIPPDMIHQRVGEALQKVGLSGFAKRRATSLSGGEMQRVAIARAIVTRPEVLLLDEPTANLDPISTGIIENLIVWINKEKETTIVIATHDMGQGQRLASRIGVMMDGRLVQAGEMYDIFYHPVNRAIASFVGIDPVRGGIVESNENDLATIAIKSSRIQAVTSLEKGQRVALCIRPEEVTLSLPDTSPPASSARNCLAGMITRLLPFGPFTRVHIDCGFPITALLTRRSCEELALAPLMRVNATIKATAVHVIPDPAETDLPPVGLGETG